MDQKEKPNYYAVLISEVRYDPKISNFSKILYAEISALCNKEGYCWASNAYFADLYEVTQLTVTRAITQLVENGYILRELDNVNGTQTVRKLRLAISETISPPIKNDKKGGIKKDTHNTLNNVNTTSNKTLVGFDDFWKNLKGRKLNKPEAKKVYDRIKTELSPTELARRFNVMFLTRDEKYIPYPAKWLRNEGWNNAGSVEKVDGNIVYRNEDGYIISEEEYHRTQ